MQSLSCGRKRPRLAVEADERVISPPSMRAAAARICSNGQYLLMANRSRGSGEGLASSPHATGPPINIGHGPDCRARDIWRSATCLKLSQSQAFVVFKSSSVAGVNKGRAEANFRPEGNVALPYVLSSITYR